MIHCQDKTTLCNTKQAIIDVDTCLDSIFWTPDKPIPPPFPNPSRSQLILVSIVFVVLICTLFLLFILRSKVKTCFNRYRNNRNDKEGIDAIAQQDLLEQINQDHDQRPLFTTQRLVTEFCHQLAIVHQRVLIHFMKTKMTKNLVKLAEKIMDYNKLDLLTIGMTLFESQIFICFFPIWCY